MNTGPEGQELAELFARIARDLQAGTTREQAGDRIVAVAVHAVPGCKHAAISLVHRHGRIETIAASHEETSIRSMLAFRLFVGDDTLGALNLYSSDVDAFDSDACAMGAILAAHAAVAMSTAQDRERAAHLERAVASNREIGMAMGVVMAGGRCTPEQAFDVLRRASQRLNVKLRDIATEVVETGELPE